MCSATWVLAHCGCGELTAKNRYHALSCPPPAASFSCSNCSSCIHWDLFSEYPCPLGIVTSQWAPVEPPIIHSPIYLSVCLSIGLLAYLLTYLSVVHSSVHQLYSLASWHLQPLHDHMEMHSVTFPEPQLSGHPTSRPFPPIYSQDLVTGLLPTLSQCWGRSYFICLAPITIIAT